MLACTTNPATSTYTFSQALQEPDAPDFLYATQAEIAAHETNGHWLKVPCSTMPASHKPIPAVWAMKCNTRPDGTLIKHKAHLSTGGHCQVFELTYWDTYSPVVQWMTVYLLLVISVLENLHTQQVDFELAFPQASLDVEIYMLFHQGFDADGCDFVLLLQKKLYGLKQASMTWFEKLCANLIVCGFHQSVVDPCCFLLAHLVLLVFVDDCLFFSWHVATVDKLLLSLCLKFVLTDQGDVSEYLGICIIKHSDAH